jgi:hypothetical protein
MVLELESTYLDILILSVYLIWLLFSVIAKMVGTWARAIGYPNATQVSLISVPRPVKIIYVFRCIEYETQMQPAHIGCLSTTPRN